MEDQVQHVMQLVPTFFLFLILFASGGGRNPDVSNSLHHHHQIPYALQPKDNVK